MLCGKDYTSHQCKNGPGSLVVVVVQEYIRGHDTGIWFKDLLPLWVKFKVEEKSSETDGVRVTE